MMSVPKSLPPAVSRVLTKLTEGEATVEESLASVKRLPPDQRALVVRVLKGLFLKGKRQVAATTRKVREDRVFLVGTLTAGLLGEEDGDEVVRVLRLRTHQQSAPSDADGERRDLAMFQAIAQDPAWGRIAVERLKKWKKTRRA